MSFFFGHRFSSSFAYWPWYLVWPSFSFFGPKRHGIFSVVLYICSIQDIQVITESHHHHHIGHEKKLGHHFGILVVVSFFRNFWWDGKKQHYELNMKIFIIIMGSVCVWVGGNLLLEIILRKGILSKKAKR